MSAIVSSPDQGCFSQLAWVFYFNQTQVKMDNKYNPEGLNHTDLTEKQIKEAKETGRCPVSGEPMKVFKNNDGTKNELYCEKSHVSVPLWK